VFSRLQIVPLLKLFSLHLQFRKPNIKNSSEAYAVNDGYGHDTDAANSQGNDTIPDVILQQPISKNER
jgi:hypothetical protein